MHETIDVLIPTFNSERYLDQSLIAIERCIPVNRILAADHHSTDGTIDILRRHGATIIQGDVSLGHARQLLIENARTEFILMLDSDVILKPGPWFQESLWALQNADSTACIVLQPPLAVEPLGKFVDFWWRLKPPMQGLFFGTMATFFKRSALCGIQIPPRLSGTEDVFIWLFLKASGYSMKVFQVPGIHHHSPSLSKGRWIGKSLRTLQSIVGIRAILPIVVGNVILYPLATGLASLVMRDKEIIRYGISFWKKYAQAYLE